MSGTLAGVGILGSEVDSYVEKWTSCRMRGTWRHMVYGAGGGDGHGVGSERVTASVGPAGGGAAAEALAGFVAREREQLSVEP